MAGYVAFLRAINVGGHVVPMARLKELFVELGFTGVETFIASGNVIFETKSARPAEVERKIEVHLEAALGYPVAAFLRTPAEVLTVDARRPFGDSPHKFSIGFLAGPLEEGQRAAVAALCSAQDVFEVHGREVYWQHCVSQGMSKVPNGVFERRVKAQVTFRGANTVARLAAKFR
jgi:uncharacterized protein (DUF1697 family)